MRAINSTPKNITAIEIIVPITPTIKPQIITKPSFPSNPNEIINIPSPGIKLEKGIGIITNNENIKIKNPTILSKNCEVINKSLGRNIFSILPI